MLQVFIAAIAIAFLFYGYNCLFSTKLVREFNRFGLNSTQRKITGVAQLIGAIGLLVGFVYYPIGFLASLGLTLLMILGFITRIRIKDSFSESAPSFILVFVTLFFCYRFGLLLAYW